MYRSSIFASPLSYCRKLLLPYPFMGHENKNHSQHGLHSHIRLNLEKNYSRGHYIEPWGTFLHNCIQMSDMIIMNIQGDYFLWDIEGRRIFGFWKKLFLQSSRKRFCGPERFWENFSWHPNFRIMYIVYHVPELITRFHR